MNPAPARIGVAGDWHGNTGWAVRAIRRLCAQLPPGAPRIVLHLGDFGIWPDRGGADFLARADAALADAGAQLWFVDGNHEDHAMLGRLAPGADGRRLVTDRIWHLPRGYRWQWHGRRWLALGGAVSLDRAERTAGRDWWPEEEITGAQAAAVAAAGRADVMVTHDCPAGIAHAFTAPPPTWSRADVARSDRHRELLAGVAAAVRPAWLMHGHLHVYYRRTVDLGWGPVAVTGLDCDSAQQGNWGILDVTRMRWERLHGQVLASLARNLASRAGPGGQHAGHRR
jgi:hypothetical protein